MRNLRAYLVASMAASLAAAMACAATQRAPTWEDFHLKSERFAADGDYPLAMEASQKALEAAARAYGPNSRNAVTTLISMSSIRRMQNDLAGAEAYMRQALAMRTIIVGREPLNKDYLDIYTILKDLSDICAARGKTQDAVAAMERAVILEEKVVGRRSPELNDDLKKLAELYRAAGKGGKTEELYGRTVRLGMAGPAPTASEQPEAMPGADAGALFDSLAELASAYSAQGRWEEAAVVLERMVRIREDADGLVHAGLAKPLGELARAYARLGRLAEAEEASRRALKVDERNLPVYHPELSKDLSNLATICVYEGKYKEAASLYERSLAIAEDQFGKKSPVTIAILENMAGMYDKSRDAAKAAVVRKQIKEWERSK